MKRIVCLGFSAMIFGIMLITAACSQNNIDILNKVEDEKSVIIVNQSENAQRMADDEIISLISAQVPDSRQEFWISADGVIWIKENGKWIQK